MSTADTPVITRLAPPRFVNHVRTMFYAIASSEAVIGNRLYEAERQVAQHFTPRLMIENNRVQRHQRLQPYKVYTSLAAAGRNKISALAFFLSHLDQMEVAAWHLRGSVHYHLGLRTKFYTNAANLKRDIGLTAANVLGAMDHLATLLPEPDIRTVQNLYPFDVASINKTIGYAGLCLDDVLPKVAHLAKSPLTPIAHVSNPASQSAIIYRFPA